MHPSNFRLHRNSKNVSLDAFAFDVYGFSCTKEHYIYDGGVLTIDHFTLHEPPKVAGFHLHVVYHITGAFQFGVNPFITLKKDVIVTFIRSEMAA